ncbi:MAG: protein kinase [Kofleriaceae bacterium]
MIEGDTAPDSEPEVPATGRLADELLPETLVDRYQIEHRLGAGGMGIVYAARDIHLGRAVAVKLVGSRVDLESGQGQLVREAQAMAKLRHPNLATVYDLRVTADRLFIVMELVDGGTLADWAGAVARPWRELTAMYLQAGRGLAAAHAASSFIATSSRRTCWSARTASRGSATSGSRASSAPKASSGRPATSRRRCDGTSPSTAARISTASASR